MKRKFFYAYKIENECSGIVDKWEECGFLVKGKNAKYKKFKTKNEAMSFEHSLKKNRILRKELLDKSI